MNPPRPETARKILSAITAACMIDAVLVTGVALGQGMNLARYMPVSASAQNKEHPAKRAVDGIVSPFSRWVSEKGPHELVIDLPGRFEIGSAHVFTGDHGANPVADFKLQHWTGDAWADIPGALVSGNKLTQRRVLFGSPVTTTRLRFLSADEGPISVSELAVFPPHGEEGFPIDEAVQLEVGLAPIVTATSQLDGKTRPFLATDGFADANSRWASKPGEGPHRLQLQFHGDRTIGYSRLYTGEGEDAVSKFHLEYLEGVYVKAEKPPRHSPQQTRQQLKGAWHTIPGTEISGNTRPVVELSFDPIRTYAVRLVVDDKKGANVHELVLLPPNNGEGYPAGTEVTLGSPPKTDFETYADSLYQIKHGPSGLVLGTLDDALSLAGFTGSDAQQYHLLNIIDTDSYRIVSRATDKCLEVTGASTEPGAVVREGDYHALDYQLWKVEDAADGKKKLINVHSGHALGADGSRLVQKPADEADTWEIVFHRHFPKKGLAEQGSGPHIDGARVHALYNWGLDEPPENPESIQFQPMIWGNFNWEEMILKQAEWYSTARPIYLIGFNEPNQSDQSHMSPELCLDLWSSVEAIKLPLVSLCTAYWQNGWSNAFYPAAREMGLRWNRFSIHTYLTGGPNADQFMDTMRRAAETYGRPVWNTEWNLVNWGGPAPWTDEEEYTWMAEVLWRMEKADYVDRYFFFPFAVDWPNGKPGAPWEIDRVVPRPLGQLYGAWDSDPNLRTGQWYYLHNFATHKRLKATGESVESTTIEDIHPDTNFYLTDAGQDLYRIVSRPDGRLLAAAGESLRLASADDNSTATRWKVSETIHGFFHIESAESQKRLMMDDKGAVILASADQNGRSVWWRFIRPYLPGAKVGQKDDMAPEAPYWLTAREAQGIVQLDWKTTGPESDFDYYEIHRGTQSSGPYKMIADGVRERTYKDKNVEDRKHYYYVVRAVDYTGNRGPFCEEISAYPGNWLVTDDTDEAVKYSGDWGSAKPGAAYMRSEHYCQEPGSEAAFTFNGTGVRYHGHSGADNGILKIELDGKPVAEIDAYRTFPLHNQRLYEATELDPGQHTLKVRVTDRKNPFAWNSVGSIDAFWVISDQPDSTPPAVPADVALQTDMAHIDVRWSGGEEIDLSGFNVYRATPPDAEFKLIAENVPASPYRDTGVQVGNIYAYAINAHDAAGNTSERSAPVAASPGKWTKLDDADPAIKYSGEWGIWKGNPGFKNTEHFSDTAGSEASFTFTGSNVRFYSFGRNDLGKLAILLDGKQVETLDLYNPYPGFDVPVYESGELKHGEHTLTIRSLGEKSTNSSGIQIIIDAFEYKTTKE